MENEFIILDEFLTRDSIIFNLPSNRIWLEAGLCIHRSTGSNLNPESRTVDCIHVRVVPRTADVDIIAFHDEFSNNSQPTQIEMMYRSANHTHGTVAVNGVHIMSLGSSFDDESHNQTNGTSSQQSVRLNVRHFVHGNNNVCIHVTSEGGENLSRLHDVFPFRIPSTAC